MNRTLLFGEGLFETIKWLGENKKLKRHYNRLVSSCKALGYPCPDYQKFVGAIKQTAKGTNLYVKFLLTFEGSSYFPDYPVSYRYSVVVKDLPNPPQKVKLCLSTYRRHSSDPVCRHKSTSYLFNILVKRFALSKGFFDGLILNEKDWICETSSSNIVFFKGSRLYTPCRESGLLWGTTLSAVVEKLEVKEEIIKNLDQFDGAFILNSLMDCCAVECIEDINYHVDEDLKKEILKVIEDEERTHT